MTAEGGVPPAARVARLVPGCNVNRQPSTVHDPDRTLGSAAQRYLHHTQPKTVPTSSFSRMSQFPPPTNCAMVVWSINSQRADEGRADSALLWPLRGSLPTTPEMPPTHITDAAPYATQPVLAAGPQKTGVVDRCRTVGLCISNEGWC